MSKIASIALAGALAAAALVPSATTATARDWHHHRHYCYNCGWNPGSAFFAGTVLGLGFGALAGPAYYYPPPPPVYYAPYPPPPYPARYSGNPHIDWCSATYRSYNAESDTWVDRNGVVRQCDGPY